MCCTLVFTAEKETPPVSGPTLLTPLFSRISHIVVLDPWPAESTGAALKILGTVAMEDNYKVMHGLF